MWLDGESEKSEAGPRWGCRGHWGPVPGKEPGFFWRVEETTAGRATQGGVALFPFRKAPSGCCDVTQGLCNFSTVDIRDVLGTVRGGAASLAPTHLMPRVTTMDIPRRGPGGRIGPDQRHWSSLMPSQQLPRFPTDRGGNRLQEITQPGKGCLQGPSPSPTLEGQLCNNWISAVFPITPPPLPQRTSCPPVSPTSTWAPS